jgi:hypothetical protein
LAAVARSYQSRTASAISAPALLPLLNDPDVWAGDAAAIDKHLARNASPDWLLSLPREPKGGWPIVPQPDGLVVIDHIDHSIRDMQSAASCGRFSSEEVLAAIRDKGTPAAAFDAARFVNERRIHLDVPGQKSTVLFDGSIADLEAAAKRDISESAGTTFVVDATPMVHMLYRMDLEHHAEEFRDYLESNCMLSKAARAAWRSFEARMFGYTPHEECEPSFR